MLSKQLTPSIQQTAPAQPATTQQQSKFRSWTAGLLVAGVIAGVAMLALHTWIAQAASQSREILTATSGTSTYTLVATESAGSMVNAFSVLVLVVVSAAIVSLAGMLRSNK